MSLAVSLFSRSRFFMPAVLNRLFHSGGKLSTWYDARRTFGNGSERHVRQQPNVLMEPGAPPRVLARCTAFLAYLEALLLVPADMRDVLEIGG